MAEVTKMYDLYDYIYIDELFQWIEEQASEKIVKDIQIANQCIIP